MRNALTHNHVVPLTECTDNVTNAVASVYEKEWGWHFVEEWGLHNAAEIADDLRTNFASCTYVMLSDYDGSLIGTVALLPEDLQTHKHIKPWITCLWVDPAYRGRGIGRCLAEHAVREAKTNTVYLWCTSVHERDLYMHWGCEIVDEVVYNGGVAWVMRYCVTGIV